MANQKIVLITGGNTGLGFEVVKALFQSPEPYHIILGCRGSKSRAEEAIASVKELVPNTSSTAAPLSIDISSDESIDSAYEEVKSTAGRVDILINNAGAAFDDDLGKLSAREVWNKSWDVNVSGTHVMTYKFIPLLLNSSDPRLLFMTSGLSGLTEMAGGKQAASYVPPPTGWPKPRDPAYWAYRASKTGMNMMVLNWSNLLQNDGVKVFCVSPGFLATGLAGGPERMKKLGAMPADIGAKLVKEVVEGKRDEDVGKIVRINGIQPW